MNRSARKPSESVQEFGLVAGAVRVAEDLPRSPNRKRCVASKESESSDSVDRRFQPEEERLAGGQGGKPTTTRPPEVDFAQVGA